MRALRPHFGAAGVPGAAVEDPHTLERITRILVLEWRGRWPVQGGVLGPTPYRAGGPPIWMAGSVRPALERAARHFDGWFANEADLDRWKQQWAEVQQILREAGRDAGEFVAAIYATLAIDEDAGRAGQRIDAFLEGYYGQPAEALRRRQAVFGGPPDAAADFLRGFTAAGASHVIVRLVGEPDRQLETAVGFREQLGT